MGEEAVARRWIEGTGAAVSVQRAAAKCRVEYVVMVFSPSRRLSCPSVLWSSMVVQVGRQHAS